MKRINDIEMEEWRQMTTREQKNGKSLPVKSRFLLYTTEDEKQRIEVRLEDETVWLTQSAIVELFQTTKQNVSLHLKNIYEEGELERGATVKEYLTVRQEGNRQVQRKIEYYNLEAISGVYLKMRNAKLWRMTKN